MSLHVSLTAESAAILRLTHTGMSLMIREAPLPSNLVLHKLRFTHTRDFFGPAGGGGVSCAIVTFSSLKPVCLTAASTVEKLGTCML